MSRFLDFFFGGGTKPQQTTTTSIQTSKLPEEIAPYVTQVLEEAQKQYEIARDEGYQKYPGETIAPMTQAEKDAIAGLQSLVGGQEKYLTEAEEALRGIGTEFTAEQAEKFMSPYQQAVVDVEKRKAQEDFQRRIMPEFEKQAVGAGGMSGLGSRAGVQAARLGEAFSQQLGDIQTRGSQKAYEDAYRQFTDQGTRERARAADLQNMGLTRFQTGLAEQGLAQQLAQADRAESQLQLDKAFREYTEQEQYPESELAQFSSFVYGNPFLRTPDTTRTGSVMAPPTTSVGQQLLGLGLGGLNVFGRGGGFDGGFNIGNVFSGKYPGSIGIKTGGKVAAHMKAGGGIGSLPVVNRRYAGSLASRATTPAREQNTPGGPSNLILDYDKLFGGYYSGQPRLPSRRRNLSNDPFVLATQKATQGGIAAQQNLVNRLRSIDEQRRKETAAGRKQYQQDYKTGLDKLRSGLMTGADRKILPDFGRATKAVLGDKSGMGIVGLLGLASAEMFEGQDEDIKEAQKIIRDTSQTVGQLELDLLDDIKKEVTEDATAKAGSEKAIAKANAKIAELTASKDIEFEKAKQAIEDRDLDISTKQIAIEEIKTKMFNNIAQGRKLIADATGDDSRADTYDEVYNAVRNAFGTVAGMVEGIKLDENGILVIEKKVFGDRGPEIREKIYSILAKANKASMNILLDKSKPLATAIPAGVEIATKELNKLFGIKTTPMTQADETASLAILKPQGRSLDPNSLEYKAEIQRIRKEHGTDAVKKILAALEK
jgi:hypothetical protein